MNLLAASIWTNRMPGALAKHLPQANATELATLYGSIAAVRAFPAGHPIRDGAIDGMPALS
jgi:hypothetical protein